MRAIEICPFTKSIREFDIGDGNLQAMYGALSHPAPQWLVQCFTVAHTLPNGDTIYVDDEGLFKDNAHAYQWTIKGGHQPFVGKGLLMGSDEEGESVDAESLITEITDMVQFPKGKSWTR